jgi:hypothetical protein
MMEETAVESYLNWIKDNGGSFKKIEFKNGILSINKMYILEAKIYTLLK